MNYISKEIKRINTAEAICGDSLLIDTNLIIPYSNVLIMEDGDDVLFNQNVNSFLNFCYIIFEKVKVITFEYNFSRLIDSKIRECYGGVHFLTNKEVEFWLSYESARIVLKENYAFSKMPLSFSIEECKSLIDKNPADRSVLDCK